LAKYPELESITRALEQYRSGSLITAKCMKCNGTLVVKDIPTIGTTWVVCDKGCTNYHENYKA
jgi:ssDNA-binding Zn-finger/Zn-ribbon topoisomerase 1